MELICFHFFSQSLSICWSYYSSFPNRMLSLHLGMPTTDQTALCGLSRAAPRTLESGISSAAAESVQGRKRPGSPVVPSCTSQAAQAHINHVHFIMGHFWAPPRSISCSYNSVRRQGSQWPSMEILMSRVGIVVPGRHSEAVGVRHRVCSIMNYSRENGSYQHPGFYTTLRGLRPSHCSPFSRSN